jgi:hypothetical protein
VSGINQDLYFLLTNIFPLHQSIYIIFCSHPEITSLFLHRSSQRSNVAGRFLGYISEYNRLFGPSYNKLINEIVKLDSHIKQVRFFVYSFVLYFVFLILFQNQCSYLASFFTSLHLPNNLSYYLLFQYCSKANTASNNSFSLISNVSKYNCNFESDIKVYEYRLSFGEIFQTCFSKTSGQEKEDGISGLYIYIYIVCH